MTKKEWAAFIGAVLFVAHMAVITEDVQAVVNDPNINNKPAEVAKLFFDLSRYLPK